MGFPLVVSWQAVVTCGQNPVMLEPDRSDQWLDPGLTNAGAVSELLKHYDARQMCSYPVSDQVNRVVVMAEF